MLEPVVEQRPDKSVNVYLKGMHFKLSPMGPRDRPEWKVSTDHGSEPVSDSKMRDRLNRIWIDKVSCAPHPPGPIPRFPRTRSKELKKLLAAAEKANNRGNMTDLSTITSKLCAIASNQPGQQLVERWKDIPLASEAPEEELEWLAKFRIPLKQVTVIAAAKDTFKSMLMLSLAKAVTTGDRFLGKKVKPLRVLYLNRDMPKAVFDSYCRTLQLDKSNPSFKILSSLWDTKIQPMEPDDPILLRFARRYKPLIIFDYFLKFYRGRLDNEKAIDQFMEKLKQLTVQGATVIVLHHVPKNDEGSEGFGSVYIINGADFGWNMTRQGGSYAREEATTVKIQNTKTKMGDYFNLRIRPRLKASGAFEVISEKSEEKEKWDRDVDSLKKLVPTDDWIEKRDLQQAAMKRGMSRARFGEIFASCRDRGLILVRNAGKGLKECRLARKSHAD